MDLGEQAAQPVAGAGGFPGQVVVEPDQHGQLGLGLIGDGDLSQRARVGAGDVGDHERIPGVGLGLALIHLRGAAHRQPGQVGDLASAVAGHRQRQRPDVRRLVHDDKHRAELLGQLVEHGPQPRFGVRQPLVENLLPGRGQPVGVVLAFADVQPEEDTDTAGVVHAIPPSMSHPGLDHRTARRQPRYAGRSPHTRRCTGHGSGPGPLSAVRQCPRPGGSTPQAIGTARGTQPYRTQRPGVPLAGTRKR